MRIAYLSSANVPSSTANSLQVMKMCDAFALEGHAVTAYLPPSRQPEGIEQIRYAYGLRSNFSLRRYPSAGIFGRRGLAVTGAYAAAAASQDLLITRGTSFALAASLMGARVLLELHHLPTGRLGPLYLQWFLHSKNGKLVVISEALRDLLVGKKFKSEKHGILVAEDAVDLEEYQKLPESREARKQTGLLEKDFCAGYFGSLIEGRGIELIVELARRMPGVQFEIFGGSRNEASAWRERTASLANLSWRGFVPHAKVPLCQAACDVLLMPYQRRVTVRGGVDTSAVMSPMKLFEYMAAARAILASDLPALRTVLHDANSWLLPPDSADAWETALRVAQSDDGLCREKAARARANVEPHTWRNRARRLIEFAFPQEAIKKP